MSIELNCIYVIKLLFVKIFKKVNILSSCHISVTYQWQKYIHYNTLLAVLPSHSPTKIDILMVYLYIYVYVKLFRLPYFKIAIW